MLSQLSTDAAQSSETEGQNHGQEVQPESHVLGEQRAASDLSTFTSSALGTKPFSTQVSRFDLEQDETINYIIYKLSQIM